MAISAQHSRHNCRATAAARGSRPSMQRQPVCVRALRHHPSPARHAAPAGSTHSSSVARRSRSVVVPQAALTPEQFTDATYLGLGLAGLSFVGTFFVAPQFKAAFKEPNDWRDIYAALVKSGIKAVEPAEAFKRSSSGQAVLLDVRLASKYEGSHAQASLSGPLYLPIQGWSVPSTIRRLAFAFFGIAGTEVNPAFVEEVAQRIPKGKQIIVLCETGGSIENKSGTKFGFQSRSLKAVYFLQQAGFSQVAYLAGGLPAWVRQRLPMAEGPEDLSAVPALRPGQEDDDGSDGGDAGRGAFKLPQFKLPELLRLPARR